MLLQFFFAELGRLLAALRGGGCLFWQNHANVVMAFHYSGCDSGLGHALAKHLDKQGLLVFAGVLDRNGPGAEELRRACSPNLCLIQLDVTNSEEIAAAHSEISGQVKDAGTECSAFL